MTLPEIPCPRCQRIAAALIDGLHRILEHHGLTDRLTVVSDEMLADQAIRRIEHAAQCHPQKS